MYCKATGWRQYPEQGPIAYEIPTEAGIHRVTWHAGRLTLHSHSLRAEYVLRGLGGNPCSCLLAMDALTEYTGDWAFDPRAHAQARRVLQALASDSEFRDLPESEREIMVLRTRRRLAMQILPAAMTSVADHASQLRRSRHEKAHARMMGLTAIRFTPGRDLHLSDKASQRAFAAERDSADESAIPITTRARIFERVAALDSSLMADAVEEYSRAILYNPAYLCQFEDSAWRATRRP